LDEDIKYLRLYVSETEHWEEIIKSMYTKRRLTKKEVEKRIAFVIANAARGKVLPAKGEMWLAAGDTFYSYNLEDWVSEYNRIKSTDKTILAIRSELTAVPYLQLDQIEKIPQFQWLLRYLTSHWSLSKDQALAEIALYGSRNISILFREGSDLPRTNTLKGRYHFVHSLHERATMRVLDLMATKTNELEQLQMIEL